MMKKRKGMMGILLGAALLLAGCGEKETELKTLEGVPNFEKTQWGMSREEACAALGMKESDFKEVSGVGTDLLQYEGYQWHGKKSDLTLEFSRMETSDGKEAGLSTVTVVFDEKEGTAKETVKLLEENQEVKEGLLENADLDGGNDEYGFSLGNQSVPDYPADAVANELVKALGYKEKQAELAVRTIFNMKVSQDDGKVGVIYTAYNAAIAAHTD